ncbi:MAG: glycosyltransferase [Candidatus Dormiibacterota bacterium]
MSFHYPNHGEDSDAGATSSGSLAVTSPPTVTLVVPVHSEKRWDVFLEAMRALGHQEPAPATTVVAVDHNIPLLRRVATEFPNVNVVENCFARGASGTRNAGALEAETSLLVFVDSDIIVHNGWLGLLLEPFADPSVVGAGGFVAPRWPTTEPAWFPPEFGWVVGVSYLGLPTVTARVRNIWSCNMAVRRDAFNEVQGFRVDYSKVGDSPKSEDTDFCARVTRASKGGVWMFVPQAVVEHEIGPERSGLQFFVRRCFVEGKAKIEMAHLNFGRSDLGDEAHYVRHAAPASARHYLRRGVANFDLNSIRKAAVIGMGLIAAALGALVAQALYVARRTVPTQNREV